MLGEEENKGKLDLFRDCGKNPDPILGEEKYEGKWDLAKICGWNRDQCWERRNMEKIGIYPEFMAGILTNVGRGRK